MWTCQYFQCKRFRNHLATCKIRFYSPQHITFLQPDQRCQNDNNTNQDGTVIWLNMVWQVFILLQPLVQHSSFLQLFFTGEVVEQFGKVQWCGNGIMSFDSSSFESLRFNGCWWETWQFNMVSDCLLSSGKTPGTWSLPTWGCPFRVTHARPWVAPGVQLVRPRPRHKWWDNMSGVLSLPSFEILEDWSQFHPLPLVIMIHDLLINHANYWLLYLLWSCCLLLCARRAAQVPLRSRPARMKSAKKDRLWYNSCLGFLLPCLVLMSVGYMACS